jgi:hypothetical protein
MMMRFSTHLAAALAVVACCATPASAAPFLELGVGAMDKNSCMRDWDGKAWGCSDNPIGYIGIGYEHKGFSIVLDHYSSIKEKDYGVTGLFLKYRHSFGSR